MGLGLACPCYVLCVLYRGKTRRAQLSYPPQPGVLGGQGFSLSGGPKEEPETRPFVLRFLLRRPHLAPAPGGLVLALGRVERGRLIGEAFPLTPRALP